VSAAAPRERDRPAGGLRVLADAYARYAHLVHSQLQALDQGDLDLLAALAAERDALAVEIDGGPTHPVTAAPGDEPLLAEARGHLQRAAEADRSLRRRLRELQTETRGAIHDADQAATRVATVTRSYAPMAQTGGRLDVSL
jgi:hypothetical protein